jgi:hypothetical protein
VEGPTIDGVEVLGLAHRLAGARGRHHLRVTDPRSC